MNQQTSHEPTPQEISAQYKRTDLRRHGVGLVKLLNIPITYRTLQLGALATRRKEQKP